MRSSAQQPKDSSAQRLRQAQEMAQTITCAPIQKSGAVHRESFRRHALVGWSPESLTGPELKWWYASLERVDAALARS